MHWLVPCIGRGKTQNQMSMCGLSWAEGQDLICFKWSLLGFIGLIHVRLVRCLSKVPRILAVHLVLFFVLMLRFLDTNQAFVVFYPGVLVCDCSWSRNRIGLDEALWIGGHPNSIWFPSPKKMNPTPLKLLYSIFYTLFVGWWFEVSPWVDSNPPSQAIVRGESTIDLKLGMAYLS